MIYFQQVFAADISHSHVHESFFATMASWTGIIVLATSGILVFFTFYLKKISYRYLVFSLSVGAGLVHVILLHDHYAKVGLEHGLFFIFMGSFQILFGVFFLKYTSKRVLISGISVMISSVLLYIATRTTIIEPFVAPEGIDSIGIITKTIEMLLILFLAYYLKNISKKKIMVGIIN